MIVCFLNKYAASKAYFCAFVKRNSLVISRSVASDAYFACFEKG